MGYTSSYNCGIHGYPKLLHTAVRYGMNHRSSEMYFNEFMTFNAMRPVVGCEIIMC